MEFADLQLAKPVLKSLQTSGYSTPTPIQKQAIPPVLDGADLLGIAQTGTGKTAAFALPILTRLVIKKKQADRKCCRVLVLSPTRELAAQIADSFRRYGQYAGTRVAMICGGVGLQPQIAKMARGVDILVATPGRLIDHMDRGTVKLAGTEIFVLDEADQMLDLGFLRPIQKIAASIGRERQNLFFSATMPKEIAKLADELLRNPVKVSVAPVSSTAERVSQHVIHIEKARKMKALVSLFKHNDDMTRSLVFTRTKRGADRVAQALNKAGVEAAAIHGNKSQGQRERALKGFKAGKVRVLVATDIASRGIDVSGVSHVVNFELPEVPEAYVHRIGRTARAGAEGFAISFCDALERGLLKAIEKVTRQRIPFEDQREDQTESLDVIHKKPAKTGRGSGRPGRTGPSRNQPRRDKQKKPGAKRGGRSSASRHASAPAARGDPRDARSAEQQPIRPSSKPPKKASGTPDGKPERNAAKSKRRHRGKRPASARGKPGAPSGASRMKRKPGSGRKQGT